MQSLKENPCIGTDVSTPFFNIDEVISSSFICDIVELTINIKYQTLYLNTEIKR